MCSSISSGVDIYINNPAGIPATDFSNLYICGDFEQFSFSVQFRITNSLSYNAELSGQMERSGICSAAAAGHEYNLK